MRGYLAVTDSGWYRHLQARPDFDEVNFWRPGRAGFAALKPGELFFFKLRGRSDAIAGFGQFSRFERLPVWLAWEVFGEANGVATESELVERLGRLRHDRTAHVRRDTTIGCIFVAFPVFLAPDDWVRSPADWARNIVSGKTYELSHGEGRRVWDECAARAVAAAEADRWWDEEVERDRFGAQVAIRPRLGQGSFRFAVRDAYGGACAVTTEHSLPVLEAAHIRPYREGGSHSVSNGILLRRDLHRLFDLGFVTVRPDHTFAVSRALRNEYANGRTYYELDGREIVTPAAAAQHPDRDSLEWHRDVLFRG